MHHVLQSHYAAPLIMRHDAPDFAFDALLHALRTTYSTQRNARSSRLRMPSKVMMPKFCLSSNPCKAELSAANTAKRSLQKLTHRHILVRDIWIIHGTVKQGQDI